MRTSWTGLSIARDHALRARAQSPAPGGAQGAEGTRAPPPPPPVPLWPRGFGRAMQEQRAAAKQMHPNFTRTGDVQALSCSRMNSLLLSQVQIWCSYHKSRLAAQLQALHICPHDLVSDVAVRHPNCDQVRLTRGADLCWKTWWHPHDKTSPRCFDSHPPEACADPVCTYTHACD